jgi:hypothetical protein
MPHGVLLFAIPAAPQEPLAALSGLGVLHLVDFDAATLHTARRISPPLLLKEFDRCQFIRASQWNLCDDGRFGEIV